MVVHRFINDSFVVLREQFFFFFQGKEVFLTNKHLRESFMKEYFHFSLLKKKNIQLKPMINLAHLLVLQFYFSIQINTLTKLGSISNIEKHR